LNCWPLRPKDPPGQWVLKGPKEKRARKDHPDRKVLRDFRDLRDRLDPKDPKVLKDAKGRLGQSSPYSFLMQQRRWRQVAPLPCRC